MKLKVLYEYLHYTGAQLWWYPKLCTRLYFDRQGYVHTHSAWFHYQLIATEYRHAS
ncbi:hypothetical protein MPH_08207, partial [Macrophomina phaseolina MS6]